MIINPTSDITNEEIQRRLNDQENKMNQILKALAEVNSGQGVKLNSKPTKMSKIKAASRSFAEYSTISGLGRVWLSNVKFMRFVWFLVLVIFTVLLFYAILTKYNDYLAYDVISLTKSLHATSATFPAITLCSFSTFTFTGCSFDSNEECIKEFESFSILDKSSQESVYCFRFNSPTSPGFNGTKSGTRLAVHLTVASIASLVYFYVTDNYLNSFDSYIPIYASPGSKYDVFISKLVDIKLPEPYNPCFNMQDDTYRQDNCIHSCIQKNLHSKLNCTIPGFYMTPMLTICNNPINASTIYEAKCLGECASKECKSTRYEVSLSRTELPRLLGSTSKTIWFDFKYRLNSYEITQVPKTTLADMLASLGGMLGIFLGSGLLSVVEILEYLIEVTIIILSD